VSPGAEEVVAPVSRLVLVAAVTSTDNQVRSSGPPR